LREDIPFEVNHTVETDMMKLVVEIECFGVNFDEFNKETGSSDEFNKETGSSDELQPKQADMNCVHALNEPHLHEIHVVPNKHEADRIHHKAYTPFPISSRKFLA
ncbi:hypothetical protein Tco_0433441, partial [Tanacetum coccineum]